MDSTNTLVTLILFLLIVGLLIYLVYLFSAPRQDTVYVESQPYPVYIDEPVRRLEYNPWKQYAGWKPFHYGPSHPIIPHPAPPAPVPAPPPPAPAPAPAPAIGPIGPTAPAPLP